MRFSSALQSTIIAVLAPASLTASREPLGGVGAVWLANSLTKQRWRNIHRLNHTWPKGQAAKLDRLPMSSFVAGVLMQPTLSCPLELQRTEGTAGEGLQGRVLCGFGALLAAVRRQCTVFSFGSNFDWSFERSIQRWAREAGKACDIHIFDPTLGPAERVGEFRQTLARHSMQLHEKALASAGSTSIQIHTRENVTVTYPATSLASLRRKHSCVDVLKLDVEGAEFSALGFRAGWKEFRPPRWCAGLLLLELHPDKVSLPHARLGVVMDFVLWLEAANMHLYHSEVISPNPKFFGRFELAFANVTWLQQLAQND